MVRFLQKDFPVHAGRNSGEHAEIVGKMALVRKTGHERGLGRGRALFQQLFGLVNADIFQITVGGDSPLLGKGPQQRGLAQSAVAAELLQRDRWL